MASPTSRRNERWRLPVLAGKLVRSWQRTIAAVRRRTDSERWGGVARRPRFASGVLTRRTGPLPRRSVAGARSIWQLRGGAALVHVAGGEAPAGARARIGSDRRQGPERRPGPRLGRPSGMARRRRRGRGRTRRRPARARAIGRRPTRGGFRAVGRRPAGGVARAVGRSLGHRGRSVPSRPRASDAPPADASGASGTAGRTCARGRPAPAHPCPRGRSAPSPAAGHGLRFLRGRPAGARRSGAGHRQDRPGRPEGGAARAVGGLPPGSGRPEPGPRGARVRPLGGAGPHG
jgi:hypothetical protein